MTQDRKLALVRRAVLCQLFITRTKYVEGVYRLS